LSKYWINEAAYKDSDFDYDLGDDICTGTACKCDTWAGLDQYRYQCCDTSHAGNLDFTWEQTLLEFNANYDTETKSAIATQAYAGGSIETTSAAYLKLKAVIDVDITASHYNHAFTGFLDHANIPTGVKEIDAYVEGEADLIAKVTISSGALSSTLGPYELVAKTQLADLQFYLGYFPVKVKLAFRLQAVIEASLTYNFPAPVVLGARAQGTLKYGGLYQSDGNTFTKHDDFTLSYTYEQPDLGEALKSSTLTGDVKLTLVPTVYITMYDLVPLEFQFNIYAGLNFIKYPLITEVDATRKCPGLNGDLYYEVYYGVEAQFRVRQLIIPEAWVIPGFESVCSSSAQCDTAHANGNSCHPCFAHLKLTCLTSNNKYYWNHIQGDTTMVTTDSDCGSQTAPYCKCLKFSAADYTAGRMFSADPSVIYFAKYPKTGVLTILEKSVVPKSVCAICSGCIDLTAFYNAVATFSAALNEINSYLASFVANFKTELVTRINNVLGAARQAEYLITSMISAVIVCAQQTGGASCPASDGRRLLIAESPRRSNQVQVDYKITPATGYDARSYEAAASSVAARAATAAVQVVPGIPTKAPTGVPTKAPTPPLSTISIKAAVTFSQVLTPQQETTAKITYKDVVEAQYSELSLSFTVTLARLSRRAASYSMTAEATTANPDAATTVSTSSLSSSLGTALAANLVGIRVTATVETPQVSSPSPDNVSSSSGGSGLPVGVIAAIAIGILLMVGAAVLLFIWFHPVMAEKKESLQGFFGCGESATCGESQKESKKSRIALENSKEPGKGDTNVVNEDRHKQAPQTPGVMVAMHAPIDPETPMTNSLWKVAHRHGITCRYEPRFDAKIPNAVVQHNMVSAISFSNGDDV
jgi:hypothetical protein